MIRDVVAAVEPVLRAMFPTYFHIGKIGDGGRAKLAVNLILGLNRLAVAEGLVFAERLGLDPEAFLKVARSSAAYSQVMDIKGAKMIRGEFAAEGRISQHLKDVHLMLEQAEARKAAASAARNPCGRAGSLRAARGSGPRQQCRDQRDQAAYAALMGHLPARRKMDARVSPAHDAATNSSAEVP